MPITANGTTVYRIGEALGMAGVSRATYFRWIRDGRIPDARFRDRNGRRVFTAEEVESLRAVVHRLVEASPQFPIPLEVSGD
jgi:predicted site-specific integrase-resolvase